MTELVQKIVALDVWHVQLPVVSRRDHGIGTVANSVDVVVVKLTSESGTTGFGEASPWAVFTGTAESNFAALDRYIRPLVIGRPVQDVRSIMREAEQVVVHATEAKAALESALLDLQGKLLGVPVHALLGGAVREKIPLSVSLANPEFREDLQLVEGLHEQGIRLVKFKTGIRDHAFDLQRIETLQREYPDIAIRVDYNQGLAPTDALRQLRDIDALGVDFIEQPVPRQYWQSMQHLTAALDTPVLADETVFNPGEMLIACERRLCNAVSIKIMKSGGLERAQQVVAIAEAAGMAAYGGDMFETGLAHLAGTHLIAATPGINLGCEFYQATYYLNEDILDEPFPVESGQVLVPNGPGLGITVNEERLHHFSIAHSE